MRLSGIILCTLAASTHAFISPRAKAPIVSLKKPKTMNSRFSEGAVTVTRSALSDVLGPPLTAYADIWTPGFTWAQENGLAPDALIRWGHPAAMATVLLTMGVAGSYLGWQTRLGNGGDVNILTVGETVREAHPKIMGGAFFFFLLGGQGGFVLTAVQGKPIMESPHAATAVAGISLLFVQALLPTLFKGDSAPAARTAHAYLGTATMVLLFVHMFAGINLGINGFE